MNSFFMRHPGSGQLLLFADRELPALVNLVMSRHLASCEACRNNLEQIQRATAAFNEYREEEILPHLPERRSPWRDLRPALATFDLAHPRRKSKESGRRPLSFPKAGFGRWAVGVAVLAGVALAVVTVMRLEKEPARPSAPVDQPKPAPRPAPHLTKPLETPAPRNLESAPLPEAARSPADTEVRVFAALHRIGADLDDPIEVASAARGGVDVTGLSVPEPRQAEIREALSAVPGVAVRFSRGTIPQTAPGPAPSSSAVKPARGPFDASFERHFGGRTALDLFSNRLLDETDVMLARAQAIHNLLARFPKSRRAELHDTERALLDDMLGAHQVVFRQHARTVVRLVGPIGAVLGATETSDAGPSGPDPLAAARRMDRALNVIFGGAATGLAPSELVAELSESLAGLKAAIGANQ
jgi:hypothetical protein